MTYPGRRPVTVRWTETADAADAAAGDAGRVSAEIDAWLARQPAAAPEPALGGLRDGLARLLRDPRIARDAAFRDRLAELPARAENAETLFGALSDLLARAEMLAGTSVETGTGTRPGDDPASRARRVILRL